MDQPTWTNPPPCWQGDFERLQVQSAARTDFWRLTHDGGIRDNGHFYHVPVRGDFDVHVRVSGRYRDQYDQAGLMIRVDAAHWIKCGIEYTGGVQCASTVVTREWSDWSILPLGQPASLWLRLQRRGSTVEVFYSLDGDRFQLMRQAYLAGDGPLQVGPMIAAPTGDGFEAIFQDFDLTAGSF